MTNLKLSMSGGDSRTRIRGRIRKSVSSAAWEAVPGLDEIELSRLVHHELTLGAGKYQYQFWVEKGPELKVTVASMDTGEELNSRELTPEANGIHALDFEVKS